MANRLSQLRASESGRYSPYPPPAPSSSPSLTRDGGDIYVTKKPQGPGNAPDQSGMSSYVNACEYFGRLGNNIGLLVEEMKNHSVSHQFECVGRIFRRTSQTQFLEEFAVPDVLDDLMNKVYSKSITLPSADLADPFTRTKVIVQANEPFLWYGGLFPCVYKICMTGTLLKLELILKLGWDFFNKYSQWVDFAELSAMIDTNRSPALIRYFNKKLDCCYSWLNSARRLRPVLNLHWILPAGVDERNMALLNDRALFMKALLGRFVALRDRKEKSIEEILSRTIQMNPFIGMAFTFAVSEQTSIESASSTPKIAVTVVRNLRVAPAGSSVQPVRAGKPTDSIQEKELK
jgi:hypothetical protein